MIAVDTSVVVAGFASWHEGHAAARRALDRRPRLPAHVALETLSVLTRLPPPHRAAPALVVSFLGGRFADPLIGLPPAQQRALLREASEHGLVGGTLYDALVAATARHAGALLLTGDRRAVRTYDALGVAYEIIA